MRVAAQDLIADLKVARAGAGSRPFSSRRVVVRSTVGQTRLRRPRQGNGPPALLNEPPTFERSFRFHHFNLEETAMNLSTTEVSLILAGCVLVIGGIVILWRRGVFAPKTTDSAKPAHTGEAAK